MLSQLTIQNFALIDRVSIEWNEALNVLTGETGAGKSILIDALRYVLGERFDTSNMRDPGLPCIVEAVFDLNKETIKGSEILGEHIQANEGTLIVQRTYTPDGKNKIKVNGFSLTLGQLKEIGDSLVDFHGPNDHQMLLSDESHIRILDRLCSGMPVLKKNYDGIYKEYAEALKALDDIQKSAESRVRDIELLGRQIKELERVPLSREKYDETISRQAQIDNRERLHRDVTALLDLLDGDDTGVAALLQKTFSSARSLVNVDGNVKSFRESLESIQAETDSLIRELRSYEEGLSFEPGEAERINGISDAYHDILKRYGPTIDAAKEFYKKTKERYDFLNDLEVNEDGTKKRLSELKSKLAQAAARMTKERHGAAKGLDKTIESELKELGILRVRFECRIERSEPGPDGADKVTFYISPNAGEELKPLSEIVSSGEAARVMLALKKALTKVDPIPVLIFDEIDAQVGGRLGSVMGKKLSELALDRQVILITHLPQIAGFADSHFHVLKKVLDKRTATVIEKLDKEKRITEMSKMMSGDRVSDISRTHAEDMLKSAANIRSK